jgi:hypothetical protein
VKLDPNIERPLPHNLDAERAILGAILLGANGAAEAISQLQLTDFFLHEHQLIFRHIGMLRERGDPIDDLVLLCESLSAANELEAAGGAGYVSQIPEGLPRVNNIPHYVEIVKTKAELRKRAHIAESILELVLGASGNASEALQEIAKLSAQLREDAGQKRILKFRSGAEIATMQEPVEWIVPGFVVKGGITELGAKVKAGKTTLVMKLVRAVGDGLYFLDRPTLKTPTVYLTEQPSASFRQAMERAGLLGRDDFRFLRHGDTRGMPWTEVAAEAIDECARTHAVLLVVDTLPQFACLKGDSENNAGDALAAMQPLLRAAADGIGVILTRHERKSGGEVGDSGRGSSAFAGAVDIVLSLRRPEGNAKRTHRVLQALSRFSETPAELLIELTDAGYVALGDPHEAALKEVKASILATIPKSETEAVDLKELTANTKVPRSTIQHAVEELLADRTLSRTGEGKRGSPFLYFLSENRLCPTSDRKGQKERIKETDPEGRG